MNFIDFQNIIAVKTYDQKFSNTRVFLFFDKRTKAKILLSLKKLPFLPNDRKKKNTEDRTVARSDCADTFVHCSTNCLTCNSGSCEKLPF
jgi:hypothetical protein